MRLTAEEPKGMRTTGRGHHLVDQTISQAAEGFGHDAASCDHDSGTFGGDLPLAADLAERFVEPSESLLIDFF